MSAVEEAAKVLARVLHAEVCGSGCAGGEEEVETARRQAEALAAAGLLPEGEAHTQYRDRPGSTTRERREVTSYRTRVGLWTEVQT